MTFFFWKHTNFVPSASCFLDDSSVTSQNALDLGEVLEATDVENEVVQKKRKRKRVVIYSESDGEVESDDEGPRAKIDVKAKNDEIGIIVERCL